MKKELPALTEMDEDLADTCATILRLQDERQSLQNDAKLCREEIQNGAVDKAAQVEAVLAGKPLSTNNKAVDRLAIVLQRISVIDQAIDDLFSRKMNLEMRASRKLCDLVRPEHDRIVDEMAKAVLSLHAASELYFDLTERIRRQGGSCGSLPNLNLNAVSHPKDHSSAAAYFLRSVRDAGLLKPAQLPEAIR